MSAPARVTVAVPTRDRPRSLVRTVRSILAGSRVPDEIVIVDQSVGSRTADPAGDLAAVPGGSRIRYFRSQGRGLSANRNDAFHHSVGDFIAFCDDDVEVGPEWLERMLREWREVWNGRPALVTGRILAGGEFGDREPVPGVRASPERQVLERALLHQDVLYGGHFGAPRTLFERLGPRPFDELFGVGSPWPGAEDQEFGHRVLRAGFPIVYEPSIWVVHHPRRGNWVSTAYRHAVGNGGWLASRALAGERAAWTSACRAILVSGAKSAKALLRLRAQEAAIRLANGFGILTGFARWLWSTRDGIVRARQDDESVDGGQ